MYQFKSISLCNTTYKVLRKIIVNLLKHIIDKIVYPYQSGFILGRRIHDTIIVVKEMVHSMHKARGKTGCFVMKVYLAKAYD